jgi:hypothetical protein
VITTRVHLTVSRLDRIIIFAAVFLASAVTGCTTGVRQARTVTTAAYRVEAAGWEAFDSFDLAKQEGMKARHAPVAEFDAYIVGQKLVRRSFEALRHLTNTAADGIAAFEAGAIKQVDWIRLISAVLEGARALRDAGKVIGFEVPGLADLIGGG